MGGRRERRKKRREMWGVKRLTREKGGNVAELFRGAGPRDF